MNDKIITSLRNIKKPTGTEAFLLICADADKLSSNFKKAFNSIMKDLTGIEKLKDDQRKLDGNIKKTYATLTQHGNFHTEIAKLLLKDNFNRITKEEASRPLPNVVNEKKLIHSPSVLTTPAPSATSNNSNPRHNVASPSPGILSPQASTQSKG